MQNVKFCHYHNNNKLWRNLNCVCLALNVKIEYVNEKQVVGETVLENQRTSDTVQNLNGNKSVELEQDDGSDA